MSWIAKSAARGERERERERAEESARESARARERERERERDRQTEGAHQRAKWNIDPPVGAVVARLAIGLILCVSVAVPSAISLLGKLSLVHILRRRGLRQRRTNKLCCAPQTEGGMRGGKSRERTMSMNSASCPSLHARHGWSQIQHQNGKK